jgi:arylsulfatase A-like enzyme
VRWPANIQPSSESAHPSAFWDVLPTLAEVAGLAVPKNIDGISFLPALLGKKQKKHDYLYWEFLEQGGKQAVRMGDWKGIRFGVQDNPNGPIQLFNLNTDIAEENDVSKKHPDIVVKIEQIMKEAHQKSDLFPFKFES